LKNVLKSAVKTPEPQEQVGQSPSPDVQENTEYSIETYQLVEKIKSAMNKSNEGLAQTDLYVLRGLKNDLINILENQTEEFSKSF